MITLKLALHATHPWLDNVEDLYQMQKQSSSSTTAEPIRRAMFPLVALMVCIIYFPHYFRFAEAYRLLEYPIQTDKSPMPIRQTVIAWTSITGCLGTMRGVSFR